MLSYRHSFHAGNHADVLKHIVLLQLIESLKRKDSAFCVLDTHAGRGRYFMQGEQAGKTGEAREAAVGVLGGVGGGAVGRGVVAVGRVAAAGDDARGAAPVASLLEGYGGRVRRTVGPRRLARVWIAQQREDEHAAATLLALAQSTLP